MKKRKIVLGIIIALAIVIIATIICNNKCNIRKNNSNSNNEKQVNEKTKNNEKIEEENEENNTDKKVNLVSDLDIAVDYSKKDVRRKYQKEVILGRVEDITGTENVDKKTGEETHIKTLGNISVIKVYNGELKAEENIAFSKVGGEMKFEDYIKGSSSARKKLEDNKEFNNIKEEERKNLIISDRIKDDVVLEKGKTYLFYLEKIEGSNRYNICFFGDGTREVKDNSTLKSVKESNEILIKNNRTGKYEKIEDVI